MSREKVSPVWNQLHGWDKENPLSPTESLFGYVSFLMKKKIFDLLKIMISGLFSSVE